MADTSSIRFRGLIAPEEPELTGDGRLFGPAALTHRRLPAPVMFSRKLSQRHQDAVAVGLLEGVEYVPGRGWMGKGAFLDPVVVPEVTEAIYLVRKGISRPSVDLEPALTFELVAHPHDPNQPPLRRIINGVIMGFTFVPYTAFDQVLIEVLDEADEAVLASAGITFAINNSSWRSMPIAERETEYDFQGAITRVLEWSRGQPAQFRRAFLYQIPNANPASRASYHLPIADIHNGKLTLVPRAVFSAAAFLSGAHGGLPEIPEGEQEQLREVVTRIYEVLQEMYGDPRVRPPWQRGGRQGADGATGIEPEAFGGDMPTLNYQLDTETGTVTTDAIITFQDDGDGECGNISTPDAADLNTAARECAARRGWAMEGGRYPIRSKEMHGASDLQKAIRAVGRGGGSHDTIRRHIIKRARSLGLSEEIPEEWTGSGGSPGTESEVPPATFQDQDDDQADCPEGQVRDDEGNCVERSDQDDQRNPSPQRRRNGSSPEYDTVTAASPPVQRFQDPMLAEPTPLTVDDNGYVYGHLATWNECHLGVGNRCVTAPRSATNYGYFKTGEVVCADGSRLPVGKITLGTGHADTSLGLIPAAEHYDNTGTVVAVVNVGEDKHGIWVAGSLVERVSEERVAELRRSPLSGDWRRTKGNLELVAALAVNSGGFPVLRASAEDVVEVLLAAGMVDQEQDDPELDKVTRWKNIENMLRDERVKALMEG